MAIGPNDAYYNSFMGPYSSAAKESVFIKTEPNVQHQPPPIELWSLGQGLRQFNPNLHEYPAQTFPLTSPILSHGQHMLTGEGVPSCPPVVANNASSKLGNAVSSQQLLSPYSMTLGLEARSPVAEDIASFVKSEPENSGYFYTSNSLASEPAQSHNKPSGLPSPETNPDNKQLNEKDTKSKQEEKKPEVKNPRNSSNESYAKLIYRAFYDHPRHAMPLKELYKWFRENTDKTGGEGRGWMNSVRHNLSMNGAFEKREIERKRDPTESTDKEETAASGSSRPKKDTREWEWFLQPWAVKLGYAVSTTRYRKGCPSRPPFRGSMFKIIKHEAHLQPKKLGRSLRSEFPVKQGGKQQQLVTPLQAYPSPQFQQFSANAGPAFGNYPMPGTEQLMHAYDTPRGNFSNGAQGAMQGPGFNYSDPTCFMPSGPAIMPSPPIMLASVSANLPSQSYLNTNIVPTSTSIMGGCTASYQPLTPETGHQDMPAPTGSYPCSRPDYGCQAGGYQDSNQSGPVNHGLPAYAPGSLPFDYTVTEKASGMSG